MLVTMTSLRRHGRSIRLSTPVPSACTHFKPLPTQHLVRKHRGECQQRVGRGNMGADLGMMIDQVDLEVREARLDPVAILVADRFRLSVSKISRLVMRETLKPYV